MDYTAIVVSLISLFGMIWQSMHNGKMQKRNDIKADMKKTQEKLDAVTSGQKFVLQDRLTGLCERYIDRGYVRTYELKLLTNMYNSYHSLGGNDFVTELFNRAKMLPIKDVED